MRGGPQGGRGFQSRMPAREGQRVTQGRVTRGRESRVREVAQGSISSSYRRGRGVGGCGAPTPPGGESLPSGAPLAPGTDSMEDVAGPVRGRQGCSRCCWPPAVLRKGGSERTSPQSGRHPAESPGAHGDLEKTALGAGSPPHPGHSSPWTHPGGKLRPGAAASVPARWWLLSLLGLGCRGPQRPQAQVREGRHPTAQAGGYPGEGQSPPEGRR